MFRRTLSLQTRQLLAASLGLVAFLGLTGYALDQAFRETAWTSLRERLQGYTYLYLGGTEVLRNGYVQMPERSPDERFDLPGSGLYAMMITTGQRWQSASSLGRSLEPPVPLQIGQSRMEGPLEASQDDGSSLEVYRFTQTVVWEDEAAGKRTQITLSIYEEADYLTRQTRIFRRSLWGYLGAAAGLLLILQVLVQRWSLMPLRQVEKEVVRIRNGVGERLSGHHPRELETLTSSINALIESERRNLETSRHTLSDLAHSLKTPLAVLRSQLDSETPADELRQEVGTQVQRMNDIVSYQLSRAARSGHLLFAAPLDIASNAEEIVQSLEKIYASKRVLCEFDIQPEARFYGELGDLQELFGNLLENAFKWAKSRVILDVKIVPGANNRRPGLRVVVEDDGPGIPEEKIAHVLQRGVRGDERVQGHGIGLAIVQDLVAAYRGEMKVGRATELSGARFEVIFPPGF